MPYDFKDVSVLVADKEKAILDIVQGVLTEFGVKDVYKRTDTKGAFDGMKEYEPDILIIDQMLLEGDGLDLTQMIRQHDDSPNPFIPIIFMSGFSTQEHVFAARDAGINEFLVKPFSARDLYKRIERIIENPAEFVKASEYFGPDRRRRKTAEEYTGPERRDDR